MTELKEYQKVIQIELKFSELRDMVRVLYFSTMYCLEAEKEDSNHMLFLIEMIDQKVKSIKELF